MEQKLLSRKDSQGSLTLTLQLEPDGTVRLVYHDVGEAPRRVFGSDDYEAWTEIAPVDLPLLAFRLLGQVYDGRSDALSDLRGFCDRHGIAHKNGGW